MWCAAKPTPCHRRVPHKEKRVSALCQAAANVLLLPRGERPPNALALRKKQTLFAPCMLDGNCTFSTNSEDTISLALLALIYTVRAASGLVPESFLMLANKLFFCLALPRRKRKTSGRDVAFSSQSVCFSPACSILALPIATRQSPGFTAALWPELRRTISRVVRFVRSLRGS